MYKHCIGERIVFASNAFLIAYSGLDEYIKVSPFPVFICGGTFYYADGTAKTLNYNDELRKYLSPEYARTVIADYADGDKLTLCYCTCSLSCPSRITEKQEQEQNDRLLSKLSGLTFRQFMRVKL